MEKNIEVSYDKVEDIFYLGKKEKVKFSMDLALPSGDVVVDVGFDGLIKGLEIFSASKFFSMVQKELEKVKSASFNMVYAPSYASISINLENKASSNIIVPYNRKMILAE